MIKFNRIGNKLGLAGAVGVLLAVGMVANQMMTESRVAGVNDRADRAQRVTEGDARRACGRASGPTGRP